MRIAMIAGLAVALSGCVTTNGAPGGTPVAIESETIRYETAPCFGTCPVYAVTIAPDGKGTFEGKQLTAVTGIREFTASPAAYRAFAAKLAPYRPSEGEKLYQMGTPLCDGPMVSDMPSVDVVWSEASGGRQHLNLYYGCGSDAMKTALRSAPEALPIAAFIKPGQAPR